MLKTGSSEEIVLLTVTVLAIIIGAYAYGSDVWLLLGQLLR